ncbi:PTS sugar transporter subunit IIA [Clostridium sp. OS1-26]|uniref:PTS sugar transporter subunit IIA n=1 Tax=Clostridium sp. OS1-26 TaxID=3070681 RepID=UPI0027E0A36C|nr:PTS sugar transporter subunit IIA [Clostridium sp. OS1-26]WML34190.1 PTS sugar transporter subunit IIA [Clostridium sp. OS1-26]
MLNKLLNEDVIKLNIECNDWKDAIKAGTALLIDKEYVAKSYEDAIINNFKELGPYMVIAPGIVLSHARPENGVKKLSLSLITLKDPISFGSELNDPVKLVITLAAKDNEAHLKALAQLMELFMNTEDLNSILEAENKKQVIKIINKYSK